MRTTKRILCPSRLRRIPQQFSWVDQRLVRDRHLEHCDPPSLALYLFLVTVADHQGLSYYSGPSIGRILAMDEKTLDTARGTLLHVGLIAFQEPLYQVLDLAPQAGAESATVRTASSEPLSISQILARIGAQKP
jgi:hypothetical protein